MQLSFFPSRRMGFYMVRLFLVRTVAVLAMLVVILMLLDLLGESGKILAYPGNGQAEVMHYVSLRLPQLIARFLPFSVLLGTLITFVTLNQHSEVVAMKAAGLSAHQILAPMIAASLGVAALSFTFNELVVTDTIEDLTRWDDAEYGPVPTESGVADNVWLRDGNVLIHAGVVVGRGSQTRIDDVRLYVRNDASLREIVSGDSAIRTENGWRIDNAEIFDVATASQRTVPAFEFGSGVTPDRFRLSSVDPEALNIVELRAAIDDLEAAGRRTDELRAHWWHKISGPLSAVLMPLLGAVAAFGLARSGHLFLRAVIGMALGFTYFVADNFALAMGSLGAYTPLVAAWSPFVLFLLIGETVLIRTEE